MNRYIRWLPSDKCLSGVSAWGDVPGRAVRSAPDCRLKSTTSLPLILADRAPNGAKHSA